MSRVCSWTMQVKLQAVDGSDEWWDVAPTIGGRRGEPYRYATRGQAERHLRICYPEACRLGGDGTARVAPCDLPSNYPEDL